jgi:transposase-like protein
MGRRVISREFKAEAMRLFLEREAWARIIIQTYGPGLAVMLLQVSRSGSCAD